MADSACGACGGEGKLQYMKLIVTALFLALETLHAQNALPSWNDTAPKKAIVEFVEKVTKEGSPNFVPPEERIGTLDNDGTLWCEQPMYFQFLFALARARALPPQDHDWKTKEQVATSHTPSV